VDALLNWLWQGGVVAAAGFVLLLALERARANVRYVVCWAALLAILALPALPALQLTRLSTGAFPPPAAAMVSLPDTWWTSTLVLLGAWMAWAGATVVRFGAAVAAIRRARACSRPFPPREESRLTHWVRLRSSRRRAALVLSDAVASAAVLGWRAPIIAVSPALLQTLDPDELDRILIHEWAHVQRRDDLVNILRVVVRAIAGWHPAVYLVDRRLQVEREMACDEMSVAVAGSPKRYAECLMKLASLRADPRTLHAAPAALRSTGLRARITRIVSQHPSIAPLPARALAAAIVTGLCLVSAGVGGLKLVEAAVLALPLVSPPGSSATAAGTAPMAIPSVPAAIAEEPPRPADRAASTPRRQTDTPQPEETSHPAAAGEGGDAGDSSASVEAIGELPGLPALEILPQGASDRPDATVQGSRTPWTAAADGGVAIGRKAKDAGVATAGFFSRFARRVGGAF
jgi:beta-lactamase regulating signal transducer with metallopeptidase domain